MLSLGTEISDAELDRAVAQASAILSRFHPREVIYQRVYTQTIAAANFTTDAANDVNVVLADNPIRFNSETVTTDPTGTTYVRDTDYEMDYINGQIRTIAGGSMAASTVHLIDYQLDGTIIDINAVLTEPITIFEVNVIDSDEVPRTLAGWHVFGDFLYLDSIEGETQTRIGDNDHIRILYVALHNEPTTGASGSWPRYLDEVMLVGASGFALIIEALQRQHAAVVDIATARTRLGSIAAKHTLAAASLVSAKAEIVLAVAEFTLAATALTGIGAMETNATADAVLANAAADKISAAILLANTLFDKVEALLNGATTSAEPYLDAANAELLLANTALDTIVGHLTTNTENANKYLADGDAFIDTINKGEDVAGLNARYSAAKTAIANTFAQEALGRLEHAKGLTGLAAGYVSTASAMLSAGLGYIREMESRVAEAEVYTSSALAHVAIMGATVAEANGSTANGNGYVANAQAYLGAAVQELSEMRVFIEEATSYQTSAVSERESASAFENEAEKRIASFFNVLADRTQILTHDFRSSVNQYPSFPN